MKWLDNIRIGPKLIGAFLILAVIAGIVGALGIVYMRTIDNNDTRLYENYTVPIMQLDKMGTAFQRIRVNIRDAILVDDPQANQKNYDTINELSKKLDEVAAEYEKLIETDEIRTLFAEYQAAKQAFDPYLQQMIALDKEGKSDEALAILLGDAYQSARTTQDKLTEMTQIKNKLAHEIALENTRTANQAATIMLVIIAVAVALAVALGVFISRNIAVPMGILLQTAQMFAVGDLARDLSESAKDVVRRRGDELGDLGRAFDQLIQYLQETAAAAAIANNDLTVNVQPKSEKDELRGAFVRMTGFLRSALREVADNANNLSAASAQLATAAVQAGSATNQIATTVQQVAKGTSDQAQSVNKTASAVEQMSRAIDGVAKGAQEQTRGMNKASEMTSQLTAAIQQVAGNASAVVRDSNAASEAARNGSHTVEDTLSGMQNIKTKMDISAEKVLEMGKRSEEISAIVEAIEDIASQTNLLALNAAIEAAAPASTARALPWWRTRCASWPSGPAPPPKRSAP